MKTSAITFLFLTICQIAYGQVDTLIDKRDNQVYPISKVAGLYWMSGELNFASERAYTPSELERKSTGVSGSYYDYEEAAMVCPEGWRLPTRSEWFDWFRHQLLALDSTLSFVEEYVPKKKNEGWVLHTGGGSMRLFESGIIPGLGRVEGDKLLHSPDHSDYWVAADGELYEQRTHLHVHNSLITAHGHFHHLDLRKKKRLRKFMVRCVCEGGE